MKKILSALFLMLTITTAFAQGEAHTWTTKIDLGFQSTFKYINPERSDQALSLDLGIGYNMSKNFYFGVATHVTGPMGLSSTDHFFSLPVMGDLTISFPNSTIYVPYIQARGGYAFNMTKTYTISGKEVDSCNYALYDATAGLIVTLTEHYAVRFGVMYQRWMAQKPSDNENVYGHNLNFIGGKLGFLYTF